LFDQLDIIAALGPNIHIQGLYGAMGAEPAAVTAAVPEPASVLLLITALFVPVARLPRWHDFWFRWS